MSKQFSCLVSTILPRNDVWELFSDIDNWPKVSDVYADLQWSGPPWTPGSRVLGWIQYPHPLTFRYVLERCESASRVSYLDNSGAAGSATHRDIRFEERQGRTWIQVDVYAVGEPCFAIAGGSLGFLRMLTERWFQDFARFCNGQADTDDCSRAHTLGMASSCSAASN